MSARARRKAEDGRRTYSISVKLFSTILCLRSFPEERSLEESETKESSDVCHVGELMKEKQQRSAKDHKAAPSHAPGLILLSLRIAAAK